MYLKNYTSSVAPSLTIQRIESILIRCGVKGITKEYDPAGRVSALMFHIAASGRDVSVRLPADVEATHEAMWQEYKEGHPDDYGYRRCRKKKEDFRDQAERTAWKLAQDWIEVELSRIQIQKKDAIEVFLSYVWDGRQTYFQALKANGYRALLPQNTNENQETQSPNH